MTLCPSINEAVQIIILIVLLSHHAVFDKNDPLDSPLVLV